VNSPFIGRALVHLKAAKAALEMALKALPPDADIPEAADVLMLAIAAVDEAHEILRGEAEEPASC
jgi:hypothetical protein